MSVICICRNNIWEVAGNVAECTNCGNQRLFHSRKARIGSDSQLDKIEKIRIYFSCKKYEESGDPDLANWDLTYQYETGCAYISVDTSSNPYLNHGGSFKVGPRGKVECFSVHSLCKDKGFWKRAWEETFR